jgi:Delta7-sterol 5-desaturase
MQSWSIWALSRNDLDEMDR